MEVRKWRFHVTPVPHIRITSNEKWMFAKNVSDEYLKSFGSRKYLERVAKGSKNPGTPNNYYNRKQTIKRYWDFKLAIKAIADLEKFEMPTENVWTKFFLPMPKSWGKKKRKQLCFTLVEGAGDTDNYYKALTDSLLSEDKKISDFRASKFYYDGAKGFIEITVGELPPANGYTKYVREDKIK